MPSKNEMRALNLQRRKELDPSFQMIAAQKICQKLISLPQLQQAKVVALYSATDGEANPYAITQQKYSHNKIWLLPALRDDHSLDFLPVNSLNELSPNKFGILEPNNTLLPLPLNQIDMILVPIVAFDEERNRIGRGKGYYDRALKAAKFNKVQLIGIAYDLQKVENINQESWDIPLDMIITEKKTYAGLTL